MIHGFEVVKEQNVPEINSRVRLFRHAKTGAELLSVENNDENKVFGITFFTPPPDSTGIAHIMEHSVLCGSRKYPVKKPFVELIKGSLNTFLNAMTWPDKTMYPVASQNVADFYNLVDVYLDSVFYPRITPEILKQEGWHFELDEPEAPLNYRGVVFNEMKGAYSSPDSLLGRYSQEELLPDTIYGVDSGGDPTVIPDLTYENFKRFHETYYHPSNARIFFYGDDDPEERLRIVDAYLSDFDPIALDQTIVPQPLFDAPRRVEHPYDSDDENAKEYVTVSWLLPAPTDIELSVGFSILDHILLGTPASPLRKALIESGLGEDTTGGGFENELRQMVFSTGMKGVQVGDSDKVEALVLEVLDQLATEGIDPATVEASMNTVEFQLRELNFGALPRGLALQIFSFYSWLYGGDPIERIAFEAPLNAIKTKLASGEHYFESLIQEYMLGNRHRSTVVLKPEAGYNQRLEAEERARLDQIKAGMSSEQIQMVIDETRMLRELQEASDSPEDLAKIPTLTLEDLDREVKRVPLAVSEVDGSRVAYHDLFTNGILYLDVGMNLHTLPQNLLPYVALFGKGLLQMGTETEDFVRLSQRIGRKTGGISPTTLNTQAYRKDDPVNWFFLRSKATVEQVDDLLDVLADMLLTVKFDNKDRFKQMVLEDKAGMEARLVPMGHIMVNRRLQAHMQLSGWAEEQMSGIAYLTFLRDLAEKIESDWPGVVTDLEAVRSALLKRDNMLCNITVDGDSWNIVKPKLDQFLQRMPDGDVSYQSWTPDAYENEGLTIPAQVNYVGKGARLYDLGYDLHGSSQVALKYLGTTYLWDRIRVQGGAYGGFARFDPVSGVFNYLSYRDPNLLKTLENYDGASGYLSGSDLDKSELTKAIIGTIGDLDQYQLPDAKGYSAMSRYLIGLDDETRQEYREQVLSTTVEDVKAFGEALKAIVDQGDVVVLGSKESIEKANAELNSPLKIERVL